MNDQLSSRLTGAVGSFGAGMGLQVAYLQTTFTLEELELITLAEELPDSDEWPIRDLFQRDINHHRVRTQILPWLRDGRRIKFLPPIVLAVIPKQDGGQRVIPEIPSSVAPDGGRPLVITSAANRFEFRKVDLQSNFGFMNWNPRLCWLVALDGQHRIASLRQWRADPANDAPRNWTVPATILAATRRENAVARPPSQLDFARSVFVYINTQSKVPSPSRKILLDDSDPHAMIAQELIERAQARGPKACSDDAPSITLFSWRDSDARFANDYHRLFEIEELYGCISELLLPSTSASTSATAAIIGSSDPQFVKWISERHVPLDNSTEFRGIVDKSIVPALERLLARIEPFRKYANLAAVETRRLTEGAAFDPGALRLFSSGGNRGGIAPKSISNASEAVSRLQRARLEMPSHFRDAIGLRAVISGFRVTCDLLQGSLAAGHIPETMDLYIEAINGRLAKGWLTNDQNELPGKYLRHITRSPEGKVKNYRFEDVPEAGGALCALLVSRSMFGKSEATLRRAVDLLARKCLYETIRQGFVSEIKAELKRRKPHLSAGQVKDEAQTAAPRKAHDRIAALLHELEL